MKCLTKIENNEIENNENDYYEDDNFYFQKYDILNSSNINEINEEDNNENKIFSNFTLSLDKNCDENNSTSIEKKENKIDKKELRKLKNKESARKCRLKKKELFNKIIEENKKLKDEIFNLRAKLSTHLCCECKQKILNSQNEKYNIPSKNDFIKVDTEKSKNYLKKKRNVILFTSISLLFCFLFNFPIIPPQKNINFRKLTNSFYSINHKIKNSFKINTTNQRNENKGIWIKNGNEGIDGEIFNIKKFLVIDLKKLYYNEEIENRNNKIYLTNDKLKKIRINLEFEPFFKDIDKEGESSLGMELINETYEIYE